MGGAISAKLSYKFLNESVYKDRLVGSIIIDVV